MRRRVVVTGLGLVTPMGTNVEDTWTGLASGRSGAGRITRFDPTPFDVTFACEVKGFDGQAYVGRREARRYDLFLQYAVAAAQQAVDLAGLASGVPDPGRAGVVIGSGIGGMKTFEDQARVFIEQGPSRVSPFFVPMFIPDIAAGVLAIRHGFMGPNFCTVSACASSAHALGQAFRLIRDGDADVMIAGGAEAAITPLTLAGFSAMKALSTRNDDPATASRPFDVDRDGFVLGEGAAVLVLEDLENAERRGAPVLGEIVGFGMSADAFHITQPAPDGAGAQQAMRTCLRDAGLEPGDFQYINTHGTSTPHGDVAEVRAVKAVFGDVARKLVVGSTKSMTGHLLGAAGALEAAICLLVIRRGVIPPTINQFKADPECDLDCAPNEAVERTVDAALSNSFGFGGHNVSLALRRFTS